MSQLERLSAAASSELDSEASSLGFDLDASPEATGEEVHTASLETRLGHVTGGHHGRAMGGPWGAMGGLVDGGGWMVDGGGGVEVEVGSVSGLRKLLDDWDGTHAGYYCRDSV